MQAPVIIKRRGLNNISFHYSSYRPIQEAFLRVTHITRQIIQYHIFGIYRDQLERYRKVNKSSKVKKKTPISRSLFLVLLNEVFPCFHCFSKTSPTHTYKILHIFLFCERGQVMLLIRHIYQLTLSGLSFIKKHPYSYESGRLIIRNQCVRSF